MPEATDFPDSPPRHHLIVPYAATGAHLERQAPALPALPALPHLSRLLQRLQPQVLDAGDEYSLTPPHERALARELGLEDADGMTPWAAFGAGIVAQPCAWFTPCHWQAGMDQVTLQPPDSLDLREAESRALLEALRPWAEEDGIRLEFETASRWRAQGEMFASLPCASLDRVSHRRIDAWLPDGEHHPQARGLLRLQNEAQMLYYTHAINDERASRGLAAINGFWISGAGIWDGHSRPAPRVDDSLRAAALRGDTRGWAEAWQALDAGAIADLLASAEQGEAVALTLCGERKAWTWVSQPGGLWSRIQRLWQRQPDLNRILEQL